MVSLTAQTQTGYLRFLIQAQDGLHSSDPHPPPHGQARADDGRKRKPRTSLTGDCVSSLPKQLEESSNQAQSLGDQEPRWSHSPVPPLPVRCHKTPSSQRRYLRSSRLHVPSGVPQPPRDGYLACPFLSLAFVVHPFTYGCQKRLHKQRKAGACDGASHLPTNCR